VPQLMPHPTQDVGVPYLCIFPPYSSINLTIYTVPLTVIFALQSPYHLACIDSLIQKVPDCRQDVMISKWYCFKQWVINCSRMLGGSAGCSIDKFFQLVGRPELDWIRWIECVKNLTFKKLIDHRLGGSGAVEPACQAIICSIAKRGIQIECWVLFWKQMFPYGGSRSHLILCTMCIRLLTTCIGIGIGITHKVSNLPVRTFTSRFCIGIAVCRNHILYFIQVPPGMTSHVGQATFAGAQLWLA